MKRASTLEEKAAKLETLHDQLFAEIEHVNELLKEVGFPDGIRSIINVAEELIHEGSENDKDA